MRRAMRRAGRRSPTARRHDATRIARLACPATGSRRDTIAALERRSPSSRRAKRRSWRLVNPHPPRDDTTRTTTDSGDARARLRPYNRRSSRARPAPP
ncbi:hypothetical protein CA831_26225, partial [Burkholderia multivorans]